MSKTDFTILWIEDQLVHLQDGVKQLEESLHSELKINISHIEAYTVKMAEEILTKLKKTPPDLIILDIILPVNDLARNASPPREDMNAGYFLWLRLKKQTEWGKKMANTPIVVVTARGNTYYRKQMEDESDNKLKWLAKPVGPAEVVKNILSIINIEK